MRQWLSSPEVPTEEDTEGKSKRNPEKITENGLMVDKQVKGLGSAVWVQNLKRFYLFKTKKKTKIVFPLVLVQQWKRCNKGKERGHVLRQWLYSGFSRIGLTVVKLARVMR